ncbi:MAG TPA: DoxX family protein [Pyrinomonadaceae bacterium]|jgi:putative oxidoreductase|nr:DoxX family protein [Pyrinomonadaceae bacterium]
MANLDSFYARATPRLLSVLRIITGFLLMAHGAQKLFGFLAPPGMPSATTGSLMWVAGVLEFFGGLIFLIGLFTRPVAFILAGLMAVAYFMAHAPGGFWPLQNKGELAVLYCFVFLFFAVAGGGVWSVDWCIRRGRAADADAR